MSDNLKRVLQKYINTWFEAEKDGDIEFLRDVFTIYNVDLREDGEE